MCQQGPTSDASAIGVRVQVEISSPCSACTKGMCRGADTQLCGNLWGTLYLCEIQGAVKCVFHPIMSKSISAEKLEDKGSDKSYEEEGQITLSLCHLDSDHFLGSNSEDDGSIQSVARKSVYAPRPHVRKSPREAVQSSSRDSAQ